MGFKVNHYAAKTISRTHTVDWELISIELIIGVICIVLAVVGFKANMLLIFIPAALISFLCLVGIVYSLYFYIQEKRAKKP
ncbi:MULTISPECIES: hypothetical protein [Pseudoalteromonas]|uniref:Uncharacterized protein n=1 Tax=Pseudoalteromonas luteoviolacea H33 TaxID=1365251 RepID=A0A167GUP6_9GAMM|nr:MULTISPECIES: hypothetical protein [Pseudoalteromonas]KZN56573.1 hypothetical protein N476_00430 [Pseudoalteromonas luteoviolacea H33]KZN75599.1 hypothetical protein N477_18080 [Pseudoalteromonas luteoviolacea H33-S]MBQ4876451.1 hypothetical protein [Pseudoalteromonas luteoviolacea]MBQ4905082.1 hypothetical protein [Pseudoalteromonas luteoviolacea]MDK1286138.1 hypothetical protein [Pseudoalteromonas sp. B95]